MNIKVLHLSPMKYNTFNQNNKPNGKNVRILKILDVIQQ